MPHLRRVFGTLILALAFVGAFSAAAQVLPSGTLLGTVLDPSGARVPHAAIHVSPANSALGGFAGDAETGATGIFDLKLPAGTYSLTADAPGFRTSRMEDVVVEPGEHRSVTIRLAIAAKPEQINVGPSAGSTSGADNRNALTFSGNELQALSDDPLVFREQLLAMAGAGSGLVAPQFYIDGFSNGQLPPKSAIRSIRINSNPYSAEYDRIGFGRVEVTTQAGGQQLHGSFEAAGNDDAFNANNPYTGAQPPYYQLFFQGNVNGPLGKKSSFFLGGNSNDIENNAVVNAATVDPSSLAQTEISEAVPNPQRTDDYSLRLDRQMTRSNSLNGRYEFSRTHLTNGGVGLLVLPQEGYTSNSVTQTLQIEDNQVFSPKIVSDMRAEYIRARLNQNPNSTSAAAAVEGAFNGGGSPTQQLRDDLDHFEFQENLAIEHGRHYIRVGGRYRLFRDSNSSYAGFNGAYVFPSLTAYQLTLEAIAADPANPPIQSTCAATATGTVCGGATQFSFTTGQHGAAVFTGDAGVYAEDEWRVTGSFSLDYGFRFETQSAVPDHSDPEPRLGFAWAVRPKRAKTPVVTLRGGAGIFADRLDVASLLQAVRQNGVRQTAYFVQNPQFYCTASPLGSMSYCDQPSSELGTAVPTIYQVDPHLHNTNDYVASITAERTLGKIGSVTANLLEVHGMHEYLLRNANAPLPGTYDPADPASGTRPLGTAQNLYQYSSDGVSNGRMFFSNLTLQSTHHLYLWAFYVAQRIESDAEGATSFTAHPYDPKLDYGPADSMVKQQLFFGFNATLPYGLSLQPFLSAHSGRPFNIITGTDLNGDTIYNDRPAFATDLSRPSVVQTALGNFDTDPLPSQTLVPYNYARGPGFVWVGLQAGKSVHVGPRPKAAPAAAAKASANANAKPAPRPERPWVLNFTVESQNLFNHTNPGTPIGVVGSPFFDRSISLASDFGTSATAANRTVTLHSSITF